MDGLGEALSRFGKNASSDKEPGEEHEPAKKSKGGKGHSFHVHRHSDGTHHLTVHGKDGQLMHHSEHGSMDEATEEMKNQAGEGGGEGEPGSAGSEV